MTASIESITTRDYQSLYSALAARPCPSGAAIAVVIDADRNPGQFIEGFNVEDAGVFALDLEPYL